MQGRGKVQGGLRSIRDAERPRPQGARACTTCWARSWRPFALVLPCPAPGKAVPASRWLCTCSLDHCVSLHPHMLALFVHFVFIAAASRPSMIAGATRQAPCDIRSLAPLARTCKDRRRRLLLCTRTGLCAARLPCCLGFRSSHRRGVKSSQAEGISRITCTPRRPKLAPAQLPPPTHPCASAQGIKAQNGQEPSRDQVRRGPAGVRRRLSASAALHPSPSPCACVPSLQMHHASLVALTSKLVACLHACVYVCCVRAYGADPAGMNTSMNI